MSREKAIEHIELKQMREITHIAKCPGTYNTWAVSFMGDEKTYYFEPRPY
jgi:hypothetical protein